MSDAVKRIRDLLARATHASTPEEEARTCALIAAKLIVGSGIELRGKVEPPPPPPPPPPPNRGPDPSWWPFGGQPSPFGGSPFGGFADAPFGGSPFGGSPFGGSPFGGAPYPHVPHYDPKYEGMAWSRNPKPCPMCGKKWPRDGSLCPCTHPDARERAARWARSWGYDVKPEPAKPASAPPYPYPDPFQPSATSEPPPAAAPAADPEPKKKRSRRKRSPVEKGSP